MPTTATGSSPQMPHTEASFHGKSLSIQNERAFNRNLNVEDLGMPPRSSSISPPAKWAYSPISGSSKSKKKTQQCRISDRVPQYSKPLKHLRPVKTHKDFIIHWRTIVEDETGQHGQNGFTERFSLASFGRSCLIPNLGYISEAAACVLDRQLLSYIVPYTDVIYLRSPTFYYSYFDRASTVMKLPRKIGSFQVFLNGYSEAIAWFRRFPVPQDNQKPLPTSIDIQTVVGTDCDQPQKVFEMDNDFKRRGWIQTSSCVKKVRRLMLFEILKLSYAGPLELTRRENLEIIDDINHLQIW
ncbi:hypothetical protein G9P44_005367 [Scheffersomyces stipitis]|nr:hypothetical protein G9P44_005367 [Scheffersomyces stipitis]